MSITALYVLYSPFHFHTSTTNGRRCATDVAESAASAIAANSILRSLAGAAFPMFSKYMFDGLGVQWTGTLLGCVAALLVPIPVAFYFYGAKIRQRSNFAPTPARAHVQASGRDGDEEKRVEGDGSTGTTVSATTPGKSAHERYEKTPEEDNRGLNGQEQVDVDGVSTHRDSSTRPSGGARG